MSDTVYTEGNAFLDRHPDLDRTATDWGALTWGILRALYESPCHPGTFLEPVPDHAAFVLPRPGDWWYCVVCALPYRWRDAAEIAHRDADTDHLYDLWVYVRGVYPRPDKDTMGTGPFTALAIMDDHGFLPGANCTKCGNPLRGEGSGYPAELYAGTYNGLCYPCTGRPPELLYTKQLDDAQVWEYPPHSPSWRRNRETYIGYVDCARCGGRGVTNFPTSYGTPYTSCDDCLARYDTHELRKRYDAGCRTIYNLATERMRKRVYALAGVNEHTARKVRDAACAKVSAAEVEVLAAESWEWYRTQLHGLQAAARARGTFN